MARWRVPSQLRRFSLRFATNSPDVPDAFPFSWTPPTEFTFDAGIAVMGEAGLACTGPLTRIAAPTQAREARIAATRTLGLNDVDEDFGSTCLRAVDQGVHEEDNPSRVRVVNLVDHSGHRACAQLPLEKPGGISLPRRILSAKPETKTAGGASAPSMGAHGT